MSEVLEAVATKNVDFEFSDINHSEVEDKKINEPPLSNDNGNSEEPEKHDDQGEEEEEEASETSHASPEVYGKRVRKSVQRLSETLSKAHEEEVEKRAKAAQQTSANFEGAKGTELGAIPLIEDSLRKTKPINLKPLHQMIYGRPGSVTEVRPNLRKFKGFGFSTGSTEYQKKVATIQQRPMNEVREVLRLLHLEVSGSREVMATRLMDFLLRPQADKVKYKGKVIKKRGKSKTPSGKKQSSKKSSKSKKSTSENASQPDEDAADSEISSSDESEPSEPETPPKKRGRPSQKANGVKRSAKKRVVTEDSESDLDDEESKTSNPSVKKAEANGSDSDSDVPLSNLASQKKTSRPTDEELKTSVIDLLKTVDLEQTSLKVVRERLFARYPGVDLTDKKEFINTTVKEYLAQA